MKNLNCAGVLVAGVVVAALFIGGCGPGPSLSKTLETGWQAYKSDKPNFNGGLAMQILSPKRNYFISTGMGDVTNACHFRIASVTKTFTAAGIMLLNQKGLLNINDKITDNIPGTNIPYLPDAAAYDVPYKKDITIRMLLMHRAGIFDITNNDIPDNKFSRGRPYAGKDYLGYMLGIDERHTFTFDELVGIDAKNQLSFFEPGSAYHYSDTGYSMLGKIIERVSGKTYADFVKEELLVPNGLNDTSVPWEGSDRALPKPFVKGYVWINSAVKDVTESNMSPHVAEGNITSTPIDLANWGKKLLKGEAGLTKTTVEMMKAETGRGSAKASSYGLGIFYIPGFGYGHNGAHEGYLTYMAYNPKTDVAIVMFTNAWDLHKGLESIKAELDVMTKIAGDVMKKIGY